MSNIFSPNMLKTFQQCPQKYNLRYNLHVCAPQNDAPFEKGKKNHALANYYLKKNYTDKFEKILTEEEQIIWQKLKNNEYFNKRCINSEYNLNCKVGNFWIGGRLDALVKDNASYYILDYKTGHVPDNPKYDYQTMVYLLAVKKFFKDAANPKFVYIDLKNDENYVIELTESLLKEYEQAIVDICNKISTSKTYKKSCNNKYCEYLKIC